MNAIQQLTPAQFHAVRGSPDHCLVDVRNHDEFANGSEAAFCWPVSTIDGTSVGAFVRERNLDPAQTVVLLCASGKRAQLAAEKLRALLPNPIAVVQGGRAELLAANRT
jgi:rhodanese-related sulfurtransferase